MPALITQGGLLFYVLPVLIASDQRELERGTGGGIAVAGGRGVTPPSIRSK